MLSCLLKAVHSLKAVAMIAYTEYLLDTKMFVRLRKGGKLLCVATYGTTLWGNSSIIIVAVVVVVVLLLVIYPFLQWDSIY